MVVSLKSRPPLQPASRGLPCYRHVRQGEGGMGGSRGKMSFLSLWVGYGLVPCRVTPRFVLKFLNGCVCVFASAILFVGFSIS